MWGAWAIGMAAANMTNVKRLEKLGMGSIAPVAGLDMFANMLAFTLNVSQVRICYDLCTYRGVAPYKVFTMTHPSQ